MDVIYYNKVIIINLYCLLFVLYIISLLGTDWFIYNLNYTLHYSPSDRIDPRYEISSFLPSFPSFLPSREEEDDQKKNKKIDNTIYYWFNWEREREMCVHAKGKKEGCYVFLLL